MNGDGYCVHGVYVGGCGIDWICGLCEDGVSYEEWQAGLAAERTLRARQDGENVCKIMNLLLRHGESGTEVLKHIRRYFGS